MQNNTNTNMKKTNWFSSLLVTLFALVLFTGSAFAQKAVDNNKPMVKASTTDTNVTFVQGKSSFLSSHIKSLGTVGKTKRYEIVSARQRGLDSPNNSTLFVYDSDNDSLTVVASSGGAGLGGAIVQASGYAVGQYLTFSKYKPDQYNQNVNSGNAGSGNTTLNGGNSTATGNGGNATATGNGGAGGAGGAANNTGAGGTPNVEVNVNSGAANGNGTINIGRP
jgi:hypothetical protein